MSVWPCTDCGAPGVRNVYARGYCTAHLAELYARFSPFGVSVGPRPDFGPGYCDLRCIWCKAGWVGHQGDPCTWCIDAAERLIEDERALLLDPPWLHSDADDQRYDDLSDDNKAVWDRTRGQGRGADSVAAWVERLARAVKAGIITADEARAATKRVAA